MDGDGSIQLFSSKPKAKHGKRKRERAADISTGATNAPPAGTAAPAKPAPRPAAAAAADTPAAAAAAATATGAQHDADDPDQQRAANPPVASTSAASAPDFKSVGLNEWLCSTCKSLGMSKPTPVQAGCIPAILKGKDIIGLAQTGSGKTAAFALPILQCLSADPYGVFAVVLTPTRELAFQIQEQFRALGAGMSLKDCVVVGGLDMQKQAKDLAKRPHVVVATPGRLADLLTNDASEAALRRGFGRTRFLVLDEADRLLDPAFQRHLRQVLGALPAERQTLLFSATMTKALIQLQSSALNDAHVYQAYEGLKTADRLKEQYVFIPMKVKEVYLMHLLARLDEFKVRSAIVFASTCKACHLLSYLLEELGLPCAALHSGKDQRRRLAALNRFRSGQVPLLLATDVASRGLDIPTVDLVVNFDLPVMPRDYVHRVGRTARAGRAGWSLSFVTQYDVELVHKVEELIGHQLEEMQLEETAVLKGISKVFAARRAALLRVAEEEGSESPKAGNTKKPKAFA